MGRIIQRVKIESPKSIEYFDDKLSKESESDIFWPRITRYSTVRGEYSTPSRIVTSQIASARSRLGVEIKMGGDIGLIDRGGLSAERIERLFNTKNAAPVYIRELKKHRRKFTHNALKILYVYPSRTDTYIKGTKIRKDSGRRLLGDNQKISMRFLEMIKEFYLKSGAEILAVPTVSNDLNLQKTVFRSAINSVDLGEVLEIIPTIDMNLSPVVVEKLLEFLLDNYVNTGLIKSIGFHNSFSSTSAAARAIISQELVDKDVLVPIFAINRTDRDSIVSGIHRQSMRFGDAFGSRYIRYYPQEESEELEEEEPYEPNFFNNSNRNIEKILNNGKDVDAQNLLSELRHIFVNDRAFIESIIQRFIDSPDEDAVKMVSAVSKVHEHVFSEIELSHLKRRLREGDLSKYIEERPELGLKGL